jgi:hypothetical protein
MGSGGGPIPKRDAERRRKNKPDRPTDTVPMLGKVKVPVCPEDLHPLAQDWYNSLADSGQSKFYEPSDWQEARVLAAVLSKALNAGRPSAQLIGLWLQGATQLLTTEGARRRMRLEIERGKTEAPVSDMEAYRRAKSG